jgi:hypothetical protein
MALQQSPENDQLGGMEGITFQHAGGQSAEYSEEGLAYRPSLSQVSEDDVDQNKFSPNPDQTQKQCFGSALGLMRIRILHFPQQGSNQYGPGSGMPPKTNQLYK